jgi:hypothetical protein
MLGNVGYRNFPTAFSPAALFAASEPGVWYDPSDVANTLWRYNLLTLTDQFNSANWNQSATTTTNNVVTAPNGTMTASSTVETATNATHRISQFFSGGFPANPYAFSVYAKANGARRLYINADAAIGSGALFDLTGSGSVIATQGAAVNRAASITSVGNGWYRCSVIGTGANAGSTSIFLQINRDSSSTAASDTYLGDGVSGLFFWGAQFQLSSTVTEYQPITNVNAETLARFPFATLYQDSAGTTLVNAPNQPVGLMLDKFQGSPVGPEIVVNGTFNDGTSGWTAGGATLSVENQRLKITNTGAAFGYASQSFTTVVGRTYLISANINVGNVGTVYLRAGISALSFSYFNGSTSVDTVLSGTFVATATTSFVHVLNTNVIDGFSTVDNISVKLVTGNQATQSTSGSRPTYGIVPATGRRNQFTYSEDFGNAVWSKILSASVATNTVIAPNGTLTGDTITFNTTNGNRVEQSAGTAVNGTTITFSVWMKGSGTINLNVGTDTGVGGSTETIISLTSSWVRYSASVTLSSPTGLQRGMIIWRTGSTATAVDVWGAQLETGSTATAYQKVVSAFEVTEANVASLSYLSFDGIDDFMITPTITPGTDKVQVFAGVRKLSDATTGMVIEASTALSSNLGAFFLAAPNGAASNYSFVSKGSIPTFGSDGLANGFAAPTTNVVTGLGDISGNSVIIRVNATQRAIATTVQGTGNYLAYPLYIGRRGGTTLPFNGQMYGLITRFGANLTTTAISRTESWLNNKTGAF